MIKSNDSINIQRTDGWTFSVFKFYTFSINWILHVPVILYLGTLYIFLLKKLMNTNNLTNKFCDLSEPSDN